MSIKIVVDSACDIDKKEADELGIELLPIEVRFGEECYLDGVNLSHKQFFEKLIESSELPCTSQINTYTFEECFNKIVADNNQAIAITLSSKLSGTYNNAVKASKLYAGIQVVDSLNACVGQRLLVLYAIDLVNKGLQLQQIKEELDRAKTKIRLLALLGTLKYLKKGGRISSFTAFAGELLQVKPVVSVVNGEVKLVGKAMGSKKGNNLLIQLVEKEGGIDYNMPYATAYSGLDNSVLNKYIEDSQILWKDKIKQVPQYMIGSTIGTHIGPGGIAVAFFVK